MRDHDKNRHVIWPAALAALTLAALACTCGPLSAVSNTSATLDAAQRTAGAIATEVDQQLPTLQALATEAGEYVPTLEAGATQYGPALDATLTAVVATADALGGLPGVELPDISGEFIHDGGDGLQTVTINPITPGQSAPGSLDDTSYAHNWLLVAMSGQTITAHVDSVGEADPALKLIDPDGNVLAQDDDGGGGVNALITATLPVTGTYTLRVTVTVPGAYTITVE
jgi:hypothetical protein